MSSRKNHLKRIAALCDEPGEEDGTPPQDWHKRSRRRGVDRKTLQLCRQVEQTLSMLFANFGDDRLRELAVWQVEPAPDSSHLRVLLVSFGDHAAVSEAEVLTWLGPIEGLVRQDIAAAIHRKKIPAISFRYLGAEGGATERESLV